MKAIETSYAGCRFRSRIEARWAVFFDAIGIPWEYEKEGYELLSGRYLPDFWLPSVGLRTMKTQGIWAEIKPGRPTDEEETKCIELGEATNSPVVILTRISNDGCADIHWQLYPFWDNCMLWVRCNKCGRVKVEFSESNYMNCDVCKGPASDACPTLLAAIQRAASARFEFGEKGYR